MERDGERLTMKIRDCSIGHSLLMGDGDGGGDKAGVRSTTRVGVVQAVCGIL